MSENDITDDDRSAALKRILESGELGTKRMPSLLRYIIEEEATGRGERIKAYAIGVDVFERGADFDPQSDSIVRVEVGRLRKALDAYYFETGATDPVRISIPRGGYRPAFERIAEQKSETDKVESIRHLPVKWFCLGGVAAAMVLALIGWQVLRPDGGVEPRRVDQQFNGARVVLEAFQATDGSKEAKTLAAGLSAELLTDLWQYPWLSIYMTDNRDTSDAAQVSGAIVPTPDFLITGETRMDGAEVVVRAQLFSTTEKKLQWAATYTKPRGTAEIPATQNQIALSIAEAIGAAKGVMPELVLAGRTERDNRDFESLRCMLGIYEYWKSLSAADHLRQRMCLEETVERNPDYADAWGALAFIYIDEGRLRKNPRPGADPWADAKRAIDESLTLSAFNGYGLGAAISYEITKPDPDVPAFRAYCARLIALRPNNPDVLASCGKFLGENVGDWAEALPMIERSISLTENPPIWYYYSLANHALLNAEPEEACAVAERLTAADSVAAHILHAVSCAPVKSRDEVLIHLEALDALKIKDANAAVAAIKIRRYEPKLEAALISGIEEAFAMAGKI